MMRAREEPRPKHRDIFSSKKYKVIIYIHFGLCY